MTWTGHKLGVFETEVVSNCQYHVSCADRTITAIQHCFDVAWTSMLIGTLWKVTRVVCFSIQPVYQMQLELVDQRIEPCVVKLRPKNGKLRNAF